MRRILSILCLVASCVALLPATTHAQTARRCFDVPGITQCIAGRIRDYWEQNGGLAVFGYPVTSARYERGENGTYVVVQWFERNRFELHPENSAPYDVLLGRLSDNRLLQLNREWSASPTETAQDNCLWFSTTRFNICDQTAGKGFKTYYQSHGLSFDNDPTVSAEESLALLGYPISSVSRERNASGQEVLTQWFERARLEWYPDNPDAYKVQLGLLGNEVRGHIYPVEPTCPWPTVPELHREWSERTAADGVALRQRLGCPYGSQRDLNGVPLSGSVQTFERGLMYWYSPLNTKGLSRGTIVVVFYEQPNRAVEYSDQWFEGDPDGEGITPPAGQYVPRHGFGKIWREQGGVRDGLGWATAPEQAEQVVVQNFDYGSMLWMQNSEIVYTTYLLDGVSINPRLR